MNGKKTLRIIALIAAELLGAEGFRHTTIDTHRAIYEGEVIQSVTLWVHKNDEFLKKFNLYRSFVDEEENIKEWQKMYDFLRSDLSKNLCRQIRNHIKVS